MLLYRTTQIDSSTRGDNATKRHGKQETYEASAGLTQYTVLQQMFSISRMSTLNYEKALTG